MLRGNLHTKLIYLLFTGIWFLSNADTISIQDEMNKYYEKMDESYSRLCKSSALKSTSLAAAEKLFVKELRKNLAYYVLMRTNSKGKIISEAVRGKKVERPNSNAEREKWFLAVKKSKEPYYSIARDDDRGRYYLIWSKPVLKNNVFVGAVVAKIDLWDSFYEFSNSVYYPFLIRLNGLSLFSHKWNNDFSHKEDRLTVPGINRISVRYIPEKKQVAAVTSTDTMASVDTSAAGESSVEQIPDTVGINDTISTEKVVETPAKKKSGAFIIIAIIALIAGGATVSLLVISKNRKKAFLKELDGE